MIGQMINEALQISLRYGEMLAADVEAKDFGRLAQVEGRVIDSNHPAWVYGHLCLYAPRVLEDLGVDASDIAVPDTWTVLFDQQSRCEDDSDGIRYPSKEELVDHFLKAYRRAGEVVLATPDSLFEVENPNERMRSRFATKG